MSIEPRLVTYLIGGRSGGGLGLPRYTFDCVDVFFEPDVSCIDDLRAGLEASGLSGVVLPYGLWAKSGNATLHLTYDPYASSLYEAGPAAAEWMDGNSGFDYPYRDALRTEERRDVPVYSLDEVPELLEGTLPRPDVLIADTQGSEYDIFCGATTSLLSVVAVICEVEFVELYAGQRLFGDVTSVLALNELQFMGFLRLSSDQPCRVPIGMRGAGSPAFGDAVYLRKIESATTNPATLRKLAFVSHHLGHHSYGFRCMQVYSEAFGSLKDAVDETRQSRFLADLEDALASQPALMPWTFAELYSVEDSHARFDQSAAPQAALNVAARVAHYREYLRDRQDVIDQLLAEEWTPVEEAFRAHNFHRNAEALRKNRIAQMKGCLAYVCADAAST